MVHKLPVFHIGANKAGSTTLQKALFAEHGQVLSLSKPAPVPEAEKAVSSILDACDNRSEVACPSGSQKLRDLWAAAIAPAAADGRVPVFSREELLRHYFYGEPDPERLPRAIAEMAGPVRVAIVARHQLNLVQSLYIHKANISNYLPPKRWFESETGRRAFGYRFHEIADAWARVVGEHNVGVFLFEELVNDAPSFARRLCNFIGIDAEEGARLLEGRHENVRKSKRTQTYVRLRSPFLPNVAAGRLLPGPVLPRMALMARGRD